MSEVAIAALTNAIVRLTQVTQLLADRIGGLRLARPSDPPPSTPSAVSVHLPQPETTASENEASGEEAYHSAQRADALPFELLVLGSQRLSNKAPGVEVRCQSAYSAGVAARTAIEEERRYEPRSKIPGLKNRHWVALSDSFRTCNQETVRRLCGRGRDPILILETFDSLTEVEIFCSGASVPLPRFIDGDVEDPDEVRVSRRG
eukprot:Skav201174  [mRNA]  locus=scaffold65:780532:781143:- [translate_table: standard]